ncbi:MAG: hypothetical protein DRP58_13275 [Spirochaetes bacterium]|nr:MAG: hypothetical protein DRP58_13275 [Spirochaetota bacterium]
MNPRLPLYHRIENDLKNKIFSGQYKTGEMLPSERELIEIYKVSRLTAREAVSRLANQGLVEKVQGKGTYVSTPQRENRMGSLYSGGEEILMRYYEITTKVLDLRIMVPDAIVSKNLNLQSEEEVVYLERLRYANNNPVALIKSYLPHRSVPNLEQVDFTNKSLYQTLEETYRMQLYDANETIEAVKADERSSELLEIKRGTALLFNHRTVRLLDRSIIEYETVMYRSDIYKYHNRIVGNLAALPKN